MLPIILCAILTDTTSTDDPIVIPYCEIHPDARERMGLPEGDCVPFPVQPPSTIPQAYTWCCGFDGSPCVLVSYVSDCDPMWEYAVACDWGQNNIDGTVTCYG